MELSINSIANNRYISAPKTSALRVFGQTPLRPLSQDTVSFGNSDLLKQSKKRIIEAVQNSIAPENNIGTGGEATVFRIPNTEYCFRRWHYDKGEPLTALSFKLTEQDKINHCVAKICEGSSINRFIEGHPVATCNMPIEQQAEIAGEIAAMPVSAFRKLINQVAYAYKNNMLFDCANGNIIVNPKNQTLTAIDFYNMGEDRMAPNPLSFLFEALRSQGTTAEQEKTIAGKLLLATLEEHTPHTKPCLSPVDFDCTSFIHKLFNRNIIEEGKFRTHFVETFKKINDLKLREFRNCADDTALNGQQKVAKALIKQLLHVST